MLTRLHAPLARQLAALLLGLLVAAASWAGTSWETLGAPQRKALAPLAQLWSQLDDGAQAYWLSMVPVYEQASPPERDRLQTRMRDWAQMEPAAREAARKNFGQLKAQNKADSVDLQQRWREFQALSPEEKAQLRQRARAADKAPTP